MLCRGRKIDKRVVYAANLAPPFAGKPTQCGVCAAVGLRVDEIENRLRLLVGEPAVEKRALGEFAAPRKACARGKAGFKDAARHNGTAMALEFHNILARI